jgi:hypothetical protein
MHFVNSSDAHSIEAFYERLRGVKVYTAEQIRSTFSLEQDGTMTTLPSVESEIHISSNADTGSWDIYLSADDEARDFCVASRLPRELGALLLGCKPSAVDPRAVGVLTSIIHAKRRSISRVLESNGIEELVNLPLREGDDDDMGFETLSISAGGAGIRPRNGGVTRTSTQDTVYSAVDFESWELASPLPEPTSVPGRVASGLTAAEVDPRRNEQYINLLKHIVQEARKDAIPALGAPFDPSTRSLFRFSIGDQNIWRRMVGAAGELYVRTCPTRTFLHIANLSLDFLLSFSNSCHICSQTCPASISPIGRARCGHLPRRTRTTPICKHGTDQKPLTYSTATYLVA